MARNPYGQVEDLAVVDVGEPCALGGFEGQGCGSQCWKDDATPRAEARTRVRGGRQSRGGRGEPSHLLAMRPSMRAADPAVDVAGTVRRVAGSFAGYEVAAGWAVSVMSSPKRVNVPREGSKNLVGSAPQRHDRAFQIVYGGPVAATESRAWKRPCCFLVRVDGTVRVCVWTTCGSRTWTPEPGAQWALTA